MVYKALKTMLPIPHYFSDLISFCTWPHSLNFSHTNLLKSPYICHAYIHPSQRLCIYCSLCHQHSPFIFDFMFFFFTSLGFCSNLTVLIRPSLATLSKIMMSSTSFFPNFLLYFPPWHLFLFLEYFLTGYIFIGSLSSLECRFVEAIISMCLIHCWFPSG